MPYLEPKFFKGLIGGSVAGVAHSHAPSRVGGGGGGRVIILSPVTGPDLSRGRWHVTFVSAKGADTVLVYAVHQFSGELSGRFAFAHVMQVAHEVGDRMRKPCLQLG